MMAALVGFVILMAAGVGLIVVVTKLVGVLAWRGIDREW
jgi:hypothetical protein